MTDAGMTESGLRWFDSHCHLDDERLPGGTDGVIAAARAAGVHAMITVGTDAARSAAAIAVAASHDGVWATVGLHPHDAVNGIDDLVPLLDRPKVVAVGECGLDYHYDHSPRAVQREMFAAQIQLAHDRDLPLVIHTARRGTTRSTSCGPRRRRRAPSSIASPAGSRKRGSASTSARSSASRAS